MRYNIGEATRDWQLLEVVKNGKRPCSDAYLKKGRANDTELIAIFRELRMLRASGQPPDRTKGNPEIEQIGKFEFRDEKKKLVRIPVFVLKAKPSSWRLYFYVRNRESKEIEFIYAVSKKTNARNPQDFETCRGILANIFSGATEVCILEFPPR